MNTDEKIRAAIKVECDRQQVGEDRQEMLYDVYCWARLNHTFGEMTEPRLSHYASSIEPNNGGKYRTTPVTFNGIVGGVPPQNIERAMKSWIHRFNDVRDWLISERFFVGGYSLEMIQEAEKVIKEFLDIHPFSDGNGRLAWLLRVWLLNQWEDPQPLPDYYG